MRKFLNIVTLMIFSYIIKVIKVISDNQFDGSHHMSSKAFDLMTFNRLNVMVRSFL